MKALIQRVTNASVAVEGSVVSSIDAGLLIFLGIGRNDAETTIQKLADKVAALRIFEDEDGKLNRSILESGGEILVVSQFTLYGDCAKGNRPSFIEAAAPEMAESFYEKFVTALVAKGITVATGKFRTHMEIQLTNDGPTTILIEL